MQNHQTHLCSTKNVRTGLALLTGILTAVAMLTAHAQNFPSKPLKMVMPYPPGSGPELAARLVADGMTSRMGVPVVVENRTGASGKVATEYLVRSEPDGYTIMFAGGPQLLIMPVIDPNPSYDALKDVRIVSLTTKYDLILLTGAASGIKTAKELFARIRAKPSKVSYYSTGTGTQNGLAGKVFVEALKGEASAIPYRGTTLAIPDLLAGRVTYGFDAPGGRLEMVQSGQLVALATAARERMPSLPNVPTLLEEGLNDFYKMNWTSWNAVIAPSRTPNDIVNRLNKVVVEVMNSPASKPRLDSLGLESVAGMSASDADKFWRKDFEAVKPILIESGAKME